MDPADNTLENAAMKTEPAPAPAPVEPERLPPPPAVAPVDDGDDEAGGDPMWQDETESASPDAAEQAAALDPLVAKQTRLSYVPKCTHSSCRGHILALSEYEPGEHNPPGYTRGWICDGCKFNSTHEPGTAMAMFRWVCHKYQTDLCRGCAQEQGIAKLLSGEPAAGERKSNKRRVDQNGDPCRRKRSKNVFSFAAFSKEKLTDLQADRPTADAEELKDEVKAAWQALTRKQKEPYRNPDAESGPSGRVRKTRKPKQLVVSAYDVFMEDTLAKLGEGSGDPDGQFTKYAKQMSVMWFALSPEAKTPYELRAATLSAERRAEDDTVAKARAPRPPRAPTAASRALPKDLFPSRVVPAFSFYRRHHKELRRVKNPEDDGDVDGNDDFDVNTSWGALSEAEKQPWNDQNAGDRERFERQKREVAQEYLGAVDGLSVYATLSTASPSTITHFATNFNCLDSFRATGGLARLNRRQRDSGGKRRSYAEPGDDIEGDEEARGPAGPPPKRKSAGAPNKKKLGTRHNSRWQPDEITLYIYCLRTFGKDYRRIHALLNGAKSITAVQSWYTNYRKKRGLDRMIAEGLRPEDEVVDLSLWGTERPALPPIVPAPPPPAAAAGTGTTTRTSARSAKMAASSASNGVPEDGEAESEEAEEVEDDENRLPGPIGSQVLGDDGRPVAPSTNPRHYCGFCCRVELPVNLVSCIQCGNSGHQNCLEFNDRLWGNVKRDLAWTCIECKACSVCKDTKEEDKMLFCEACDHGFHMFCLNPPLKAMPDENEPWQCPRCSAEEAATNTKKAAEAAAAAAAADVEAAAAANAGLSGAGDAGVAVAEDTGGVLQMEVEGSMGTAVTHGAAAPAASGALGRGGDGFEENEETDGTHATIAGFYYDVVMRKYLPRLTRLPAPASA